MTSLQNSDVVPFQHILVIGLGVMGGSFIKSLQTSGCKLYGIETNAAVCEQIRNEQNIEIITYEALPSLPTMDLVIITVMPQVVISIFDKLDTYLSKATLVVEISGVKQKLVQKLQHTSWNFNYMLIHPMAGRENGGYAFSRAGLFENANFLLIEDGYTATETQVDKLHQFIEQLGSTRIFMMSASAHDEQITYTSQLSHVLASSLLLSKNYKASTKDAIGDSFRDLTRIANMNVPMWNALFLENKELLAASIDNLIEALAEMKEDVATEQSEKLNEKLIEAKNRRNSFN